MSTFILKLLALLFMLIDHIGYFFMGTTNYYQIFRELGRISFPIFLFLIIVGIINSNNKEKYLSRLLLFAIITLIGNIILEYSLKIFNIDDNIFFTLFINAFIFYLIENWKKYNKVLIIILIGISIFLIQFVDYEYLSLGTAIGFYIFLKNPFKFKNYINIITFIIYETIFMVVSNYFNYLGSEYIIKTQSYMILSIPIIASFNGKLGIDKNTKFYTFQKYFFYIFYIAHIYIFYLISYLKYLQGV